MRDAADLLDRNDRAGDVRHVDDRHHLRALGQQLLEGVEVEGAVVVDRRPFDHRAAPLAVVMPGHDVGMVLEDGEHDLVALPDPHAAERLRDEVDPLGRGAGEDDLLARRRVDEAAHGLARVLVGLGRGIREEMQAAMHVGVFFRVGLLDAVEHGARLLRRRGVVEIDQRLAVDFPRQDREIRADLLDVVGAVRRPSAPPPPPCRASGACALRAPRRSPRRRSSRSPRRGRPAPACARPRPSAMPRERRKKSICSSIRPQVAPWPQTTSSAKISSSGLLANSASSERSSARLIILESVFCAPGSTMILPWNTPCDWPSIAALKYSWPPQCGAAWLTTSVVSRCCLPRPIVAPRSPTFEPLALERHADLAARDERAGREERRDRSATLPPRRGSSSDEVDRLVALLLRRDPANVGAVADLHLGHDVGLVGDAVRARQRSAGSSPSAPAPTAIWWRSVCRPGVVAGEEVHDLERPRELRAVADLQHRAVAHEGAVQREDRRLGRIERAVEDRAAIGEEAAERGEIDSVGEARHVGQRRHEMAVDEDDARPVDRRESVGALQAPRARRRRGAGSAGAGTSCISARRSVYFHSSMRRCGRPCAMKASKASARMSRIGSSPASAAKWPASASSALVRMRVGCSVIVAHAASLA